MNHSADEWARGAARTNTLEGFFSIFKRGMRGVYQRCGEKHLHRYLAAFDLRLQQPRSAWIQRYRRAEKALTGIVGKRLMYRDPFTR